MTWFIQIHDKEGNVLLLNSALGTYKSWSRVIDNKANKIASQFSTAHRWEVRPQPYTHKVLI